MKRIFTIVAAILMTASVWAQTPESMSYQAVVRDASDALVTSTAVGIQISILQGGATGTAVYVETQTPTTNASGLVSLEIGNGTVVSGDFSAIDWSAGPYFIKTETDPTGGTTYSITGTSQLMSVPFALHAKTAETITGALTYTETDPIYTASEAANITASDITTLGNTSGTNTGDQTVITAAQASAITANTVKVGVTTAQATILGNTNGTNTGDQNISRTGTTVTLTNGGTFTDSVNTYTAGTGIDISASNVISATGGSTLAIGDSYQGGKIFWLDASGQHGLIAATVDQSTGIQWYNGTHRFTGTTGDGLYAGVMNTAMIIATQMADNQLGNFAAKVCADYSVVDAGVTYGDWYLPSKYELNLLYLQKTAVGGFTINYYWSSTENEQDDARRQKFSNGAQSSGSKTGNSSYVRAVRAF